MKNLHIDASIVPRYYRVRATSNGEEIANVVSPAMPDEVEARIEEVRKILSETHDNVQIEYFPA